MRVACTQTGDSKVVALLLLYGADTEIVDNYGAMPSDYAAQIGDHETQLLLLNSANERVASASDEWVECFDEESGYPFWLNANTGETEVGAVCLPVGSITRGLCCSCIMHSSLTLRVYF